MLTGVRPIHYESIEEQVGRIFYEILFAPLLAILNKATAQSKEVLNAAGDVLRDALRNGRVQYEGGIFSGNFSAAISRALRSIGAKLNKRDGTYKLRPDLAPPWIVAEASMFKRKAQETHRFLKDELGNIQKKLDKTLAYQKVNVTITMGQVEKDWKVLARKLQISPALSQDSRERLAQDYSENMKIWIKKFSEESILDLRGVVEKNANQGFRFDRLIDGIKSRYGVAQNKAKFLARQETGLFMSKFRRERFSESGITHYRWRTSKDERVRHTHKMLDGTIQSYAQPPIVDPTTGRRANPGEDFNCRCVDEPILESVAAVA